MQIFKDIWLAVNAYRRAISFFREKQKWHWLFWPVIANLVLFLFVAIVAWQFAGELVAYFMSFFPEYEAGGWGTFFQFTLSFIIRLLVLGLYLKFYRYIILILFAPILAILSDQILKQVLGVPSKGGSIIQQVFRGGWIAIRNLFLELLATGLVLLLALLFPPVLPFVPIFLLLLTSFFFGYSMADYRLEYLGYSMAESNRMLIKRSGFLIANGFVFQLVILIPFVGVLFGPIWALVAACLVPVESAPITAESSVI